MRAIALTNAWQMVWKKPGRTGLLLVQFLVGTGLLALGILATVSSSQQVRVLSRVFGPGVIGTWPVYGQFAMISGIEPRLSDVEAISALPRINDVAGVLECYFGQAQVAGGPVRRYAEPLVVQGITSDYMPLFKIHLSAGRAFAEEEYEIGAPVALVTSDLLPDLPGGPRDPRAAVGTALILGNEADTPVEVLVVGVVSPASVVPGHPHPAADPQVRLYQPTVLVPSRTAGRWIPDGEVGDLSYIWVGLDGTATEADAKMVTSILEARHPGSTYDFVLKLEQARREWAQTRPLLTVLILFALAALALAAFGLAGVALGTLAQRRVEIGLRRAVGATGADVIRQMGLEVVIPAVLGATAGSIVALLAMSAVGDQAIRFLPWWGAVASAFVGVAAGTGPALLYTRKAVERDASELLRGG